MNRNQLSVINCFIIQCLRFKVDHVGYDKRDDIFGMFVQFDNEVEVTNSKLNIGNITFLTRLGGLIGVGKELLWITIILISYLLILLAKLTRRE